MIGSDPIDSPAPIDSAAPSLAASELGWLAWRPTRAHRGLGVLLLAALLLRLAGLASPGHAGDLQAFVDWAEGVAKLGLGGYYAHGGDSNYPPMLYLLWPLGTALDGQALIGAIRLLSIPFDLVLGILLFEIGRTTGRDRDGLLAAAFYLLNPAVLLVGPMWGQVDGMGALPMVASIAAVARGRVVTAGVMATIAGLLKPQFGIAAIVLAGLSLFWLRSRDGIRRVALLAFSALATFAVVLLPLGLGPFGYLDVMRDTFGRYPYISQFGFNPWGMLFGFGKDDAAWFAIGTGLAVIGIVLSLLLLRRRRDLVGLLGVSVLIGLALYYLPTRVHERYLFGALAFLAPLAAMERRLVWSFVGFSAAFTLSLVYVLVTSPYRILPGPKQDAFPDWAISVMSLVVTAAGVWVAAGVVRLFWVGSNRPVTAGGTAEASVARSG